MGFSRQEYWSGLPCPPPRDLLTQDRTCISCISCTAGRFFTPWSTGEALSSSLNSTIWHLCWEAFVGAFPGNNFLLVCWLQWQIDGETMKEVEDFILGGSKITADGDYSHEIKRCLLLGRKIMTNLASILKSKDIILPRKVRLVKAMVFPVVIYGCESWTIKKAECIRIDTFELWCWRTLESPLDCKEIQPVHSKGNQSWIFIGRTDVEAEIPILWPPNAKSWLIWKDPDAGKDWRQEEKGTTEDEMVEWVSPTQWTRVWVNSRNWWWTGRPGVLQSMGSPRVREDWATDLNWTDVGSIPLLWSRCYLQAAYLPLLGLQKRCRFFATFLVAQMVKNLPAMQETIRDVFSIPGWGRPPGKRNGYPLQYSCLENSMDRGAWRATVHGVTKSPVDWIEWLNTFHTEGVLWFPAKTFCCCRSIPHHRKPLREEEDG